MSLPKTALSSASDSEENKPYSQRLIRFEHAPDRTCQFCQADFAGELTAAKKACKQHILRVHPETMLACPIQSCRDNKPKGAENSFDTPQALLCHYVKYHIQDVTASNESDSFQCPMFRNGVHCEKKFKTGAFAAHFRKHHDDDEKYETVARMYESNGTQRTFVPMARSTRIRLEKRALAGGDKPDEKKQCVQHEASNDESN